MQRSLQSPSPGSPSHIPLPKYNLTSRSVSNHNGSLSEYLNGDNNNSTEAARWKYKYEEAEKARKLLITKSERSK